MPDSDTNKLDEFLSLAESKIGEGPSWTYSKSGLASGQPWCAAFIYACAKTVGGLLDVIIYPTYSASAMARSGVSKGYGSWLKGPAQGQTVTPRSGDLILYRWNSSGYADTYDSDHIGIVKTVSGSTIKTIEGNTGSGSSNTSRKVQSKSVSTSSTTINGYFRPDWSKVGASVSSSIYGLTAGGNLYDEYNTREDAILREVGYWNSSKSDVTLSSTKLKCSVIDYTSVLGSFFEGAIETYQTNYTSYNVASVDTSGVVNSNAKTIISYLNSQCSLNAAASVGICANIYHESYYNPGALGDYVNGVATSFGLCQWHNQRGTNMKNYVGSNWASNISGQLDFLMYELRSSYSSLLSTLRYIANTETGAKSAADSFVRRFEVPANVDTQSQLRQQTASQLWKQIVVQL